MQYKRSKRARHDPSRPGYARHLFYGGFSLRNEVEYAPSNSGIIGGRTDRKSDGIAKFKRGAHVLYMVASERKVSLGRIEMCASNEPCAGNRAEGEPPTPRS